jgi:parvulin-like peptidyl-prolyl isomerase
VKRLAALAICLLAFGAACSNPSSAPAAAVNGTKISTQALVDELNAISTNSDYINALQSGSPSGGGGGITVVGSTPGSFDAAFVSQVLLRQMDYSLIRAEVAKRHLAVSDACRLEARNDALLNLGQQNATTGQQLLSKFPKAYQDTLLQRNTDVIALEADLNGQQCGKSVDAQGYYNSHPGDFTKLCISLIAVTDQTQAVSIVAQARSGTDFGSLVQQFSIDSVSKANNGAIGCLLPSQFNPNVAQLLQAAKIGDVLDPIPGSSGISVVKVTDRQLASLDEVRTQAEELASSSASQAFGTWLRQARAGAQVTVDGRYGTFDPSSFQINPPTLDVSSGSSSSTGSSTGSSSSSSSVP